MSWFGFPQKQTLRVGFECKYFTWEMIPGFHKEIGKR